LTYESKWKLHVNKEWKRYKEEWEVEHPNEKPPKTRFQIMNEFMKEKFAAETDKMKSECDQYQKAIKEETPVQGSSTSAENCKFQL
jgi:DNA-directed RNA polymerase subunit L